MGAFQMVFPGISFYKNSCQLFKIFKVFVQVEKAVPQIHPRNVHRVQHIFQDNLILITPIVKLML